MNSRISRGEILTLPLLRRHGNQISPLLYGAMGLLERNKCYASDIQAWVSVTLVITLFTLMIQVRNLILSVPTTITTLKRVYSVPFLTAAFL